MRYKVNLNDRQIFSKLIKTKSKEKIMAIEYRGKLKFNPPSTNCYFLRKKAIGNKDRMIQEWKLENLEYSIKSENLLERIILRYFLVTLYRFCGKKQLYIHSTSGKREMRAFDLKETKTRLYSDVYSEIITARRQ